MHFSVNNAYGPKPLLFHLDQYFKTFIDSRTIGGGINNTANNYNILYGSTKEANETLYKFFSGVINTLAFICNSFCVCRRANLASAICFWNTNCSQWSTGSTTWYQHGRPILGTKSRLVSRLFSSCLW